MSLRDVEAVIASAKTRGSDSLTRLVRRRLPEATDAEVREATEVAIEIIESDDSYLVLRILQNLDRGPDPFLDWDLEHPLVFLRRLIGADVARQLDERSVDAMHEMAPGLTRFWHEVSH